MLRTVIVCFIVVAVHYFSISSICSRTDLHMLWIFHNVIIDMIISTHLFLIVALMNPF